ncbi:MAG: SOS response-associated peptidase [Deltaproteobacteria bacterium]|nr:SOS response-associated peptidase [Deltaproteobacteria bacterium]
MCGRFTSNADDLTWEEYSDLLGFDLSHKVAPRYNIAPSQPVEIVRVSPSSGKTELVPVKWGLVPSWAKDPAIGNRMINARAETAHEKPSFRSAFKHRRCLIPATGFYEWQARGKGPKQPYHITMKAGGLFSMAGLWEHWQAPDGSELETCTILTTEPNDLMAPIHNRMPVILPPSEARKWIDPKTKADDLKPILVPLSADMMQALPVSRIVNDPKNDKPECVEPIRPK